MTGPDTTSKMLIPQAFMADISPSDERRPKRSSTEIRHAMGIDNTNDDGMTDINSCRKMITEESSVILSIIL